MQCICERYQSYLISKQMQKIHLKSKIEIRHLFQLIFSDLQVFELLISSFLVSSSSSWTHIVAEESFQMKMTLISNFFRISSSYFDLSIHSSSFKWKLTASCKIHQWICHWWIIYSIHISLSWVFQEYHENLQYNFVCQYCRCSLR